MIDTFNQIAASIAREGIAAGIKKLEDQLKYYPKPTTLPPDVVAYFTRQRRDVHKAIEQLQKLTAVLNQRASVAYREQELENG